MHTNRSVQTARHCYDVCLQLKWILYNINWWHGLRLNDGEIHDEFWRLFELFHFWQPQIQKFLCGLKFNVRTVFIRFIWRVAFRTDFFLLCSSHAIKFTWKIWHSILVFHSERGKKVSNQENKVIREILANRNAKCNYSSQIA